MAYDIFIQNLVNRELTDSILRETRALENYAKNSTEDSEIKKLAEVTKLLQSAFENKNKGMLWEAYTQLRDWEAYKMYRFDDDTESRRLIKLVRYLDAICQ